MICDVISLSPFEGATLSPLCVGNLFDLNQSPRRAVIVCPGGGYHGLSEREAEPIAAQFLAAGFATFILRYTVCEGAANYQPLKQIALAIRYVRENAALYNVDPDYVFTCGFSAGGHLAASAGVLWQESVLDELMAGAPRDICRPTGMVLSYPVITAGQYAHKGSIHNLCGTTTPTEAEADRFSLEKHVDKNTSPAFIWHTFTDTCVPVQNSLLMAEAMLKSGVPFELHIFPEGPHGLALCNEQTFSQNPAMMAPHNACWIDLAVAWIRDFK